ncbi:MAG: UDP-2,4-diacetamido-2,4,6-trideoxy-beta-L-altropyranose hydrolase [Gammaproteobacteria bacterium]|nr:UDP-2,4-diacetamido-2,4,6-trideoxy-beta-L-altropyranose hydrolase [Gammaproteobacteria bacterium]
MNNKLLLVFRLDAGAGIGLGHYYRCKSLADTFLETLRLKDILIQCAFAVKKSTVETLGVNKFLPHHVLIIDDEQDFIEKASQYDFIIIDNYSYDRILFKQLSDIENSKLIIIDDECNRGPLYADMVINPADCFVQKHYQKFAPKAQFCLGHQYALIRPNFTDAAKKYLFKQRNKIVVSFGGADVNGLTVPLVSQLMKDKRLIHFEVLVITGAAFKNTSDIENLCQQAGFIHLHNIDNMDQILGQAMLAISAAGSTVYELASCGVPSVFAIVAKNQESFISSNINYQWCQFIDCQQNTCIEQLLSSFYHFLELKNLSKLSAIASHWVDGRGCHRVVSKLLDLT